MILKRNFIAVFIACATAAPALAVELTYHLTGTISAIHGQPSSTVAGPFSTGAPFTADVTVDTTAPNTAPSGFGGQYGPAVSAYDLTLDVAGLMVQSTSGNNTLTFFTTSSALFHSVDVGLSSGWSANLPTNLDVDFDSSGAFPNRLITDLISADPATFTADNFELAFGLGSGQDGNPVAVLNYPGGSLSGSTEIDFSATSITLVPEPDSRLLAGVALACVCFCGWRARIAGRSRA